MKEARRKTKVIKIGSVKIGANHPIVIQSMAKTKTSEVDDVVGQINQLQSCGCEVIRVAVKDSQDARSIKQIKKGIKIPLVADIHFNWRLAIEAIESGADKIRLNPGNIYRKNEVASVVGALKQAKIPLRIGLNSGSVRGSGSSISEKLVKSCLDYIKMVEELKFYDLVVSLKGSNVWDTVSAYRKISKIIDYPLHLGVTATGLPLEGAIKSSIAIGALLMEGIGDTIRISLTDLPEQEIRAARAILEALQIRHFGPQIISCPTCGRCEVNLAQVVKELENRLSSVKVHTSLKNRKALRVAVMGCLVNGPGEAKEADMGIAFGKNEGMFFKKGKQIKKIPLSGCVDLLITEINKND